MVVCGSYCLHLNLPASSKEMTKQYLVFNSTILMASLQLFFICFGLEMEKAHPCIHLDVAAIGA